MKSFWPLPRAGRRRRALSLVLAIALAGQGSLAPVASALAANSKAPKLRQVEAGLVEPQADSPLEVLVGVGPKLTHIEFRGARLAGSRRDGDDMVLRFAVKKPPLLPRLHVDPPPYVKDAVAKTVGGAVEIHLTLTKDVEAKVGEADGASFVNLTPSASAMDANHLDQLPGDRSDPTPADGSVKTSATVDGDSVKFVFPWRSPLGAAVFRRGDAVFVVFDAHAGLDLGAMPLGKALGPKSLVRGVQPLSGKDYSGVRIRTTPDAPVKAFSEGGVWTVVIGTPKDAAADQAAPEAVNLVLDDGVTTGLAAKMAGATGVFWVVDPVIGDRLGVVTALSPTKGVAARRGFVGGAVLATAQGLALETMLDDLKVQASQDIVHIGREKGLALSASTQSMHLGAAPMGAPQPASEPALIDFVNWPKYGEAGFYARYSELLDAAAVEGGDHKPGKVQARMALARFLVGSELNQEAIGVLNLLAKTDQMILGNPEFRGLRGAAKAMAGRYKDAVAEFSAPALAEDRTAALWRAYVATKVGDMAGAHQQFALGRLALGLFNGPWRARFARADAESSLAVNDLVAAQRAILTANAAAAGDPEEVAAVKLVTAKALEASGKRDEALALYDEAAKAKHGAIAAPATLRALQIRLDEGKVKSDAAAVTLDSLRFMWRGDATELEVVRALGRLDLNQGRYRDALEVLRSAAKRLPDLPAASAIQSDLNQTFRALFLDGRADGLQPIQALGLFYDFKDLTPIGVDGDTMVRRLAHRLVDVDLLPQAAELLKYQSEQRLEGVARADVATDLATIYLMDRKPEQALQAINNSRSTVLPNWLNLQRRLVEARALVSLGRVDHALEVLGSDNSPEAAALKAEAAWGAHEWPKAGTIFEGALGDRWKSATRPLAPEEEAMLIRTGVAYSLAGDDAALLRLRSRYAKLVEGAQNKETLRLALAGVGVGDASPAAYSRALAEVDLFGGWIASAKKKLLDKTTVRTAQSGPAGSGKKGG